MISLSLLLLLDSQPKSNYNLSTYKWYNYNQYYFTKYCTDSDYVIVDNKTILELSDDAANVNWGGDWRMPSKAEQDELRNECTWTWEQKNGVNGYTVTGPNGNSIFLPATGYCYKSLLLYAGSFGSYWSSLLYTNDLYNAYVLSFYSNIINWGYNDRDYGHSVRPVLP